VVHVENPPIINEYVDMWQAGKEYITVVINNHGNDADIWIIEQIVKFTYRYQGVEKGAVLQTGFWRRAYITRNSNVKLSLRSGAILLIQYFYSEAQSEGYCGIVANGEKSRIRDMELSNVRIVKCPDAKEISDALNELENKNYYYDKWIYPYTPWIIALAKRLYGIQI
jgi:hypothetical protein